MKKVKIVKEALRGLSPSEVRQLKSLINLVNIELNYRGEKRICTVNFKESCSRKIQLTLVFCCEKQGYLAEAQYQRHGGYPWSLLLSVKEKKTIWQKLGFK